MSAVCWLRRQCLWNVKISWLFICCLDLILWIPLHPLILLQALCILHHKVERNIWVLVWTSVMNPSNILFPSKVIFNFIAVCLCILPNNCLDRIPTGKNDSEGSVSLEETIDLGDVPSRRWLSRASLLCHAGGLSAEGGWMGFLSWVWGLLFFLIYLLSTNFVPPVSLSLFTCSHHVHPSEANEPVASKPPTCQGDFTDGVWDTGTVENHFFKNLFQSWKFSYKNVGVWNRWWISPWAWKALCEDFLLTN